MNVLYSLYFLCLGLLLGSFYNVCIYRIPREESVAFPPSNCTSCNTRLKPLDLVPVLSYVFLKGRCRYCREKISPRYALVELFTGIAFLWLFLTYGITVECLKYIVLISFLIVIGMIDYDTTDVYSITTYSGIAFGVIFILINYFMGFEFKSYIYGGILAAATIALIIIFTGGMGWGDFEIALMCGLYLGFEKSIVLLFSSFIIGGVVGAFLILTKKKTKNDYIPFGPSIASAALFTLLFGERIISFYI